MGGRIVSVIGLVLLLIAVRYLPSGLDLWAYLAAGGSVVVTGAVKSRRSTPWRVGYVLIGIGIATLGTAHLAGLPSWLELPVAASLIVFGGILAARHTGSPTAVG